MNLNEYIQSQNHTNSFQLHVHLLYVFSNATKQLIPVLHSLPGDSIRIPNNEDSSLLRLLPSLFRGQRQTPVVTCASEKLARCFLKATALT